jgi:predicted TIM-barrel fold metal-dependent hydrolase
MTDIPIVDAHHHVWDIERNYHPWLRDEPMIPFRYGNYAPIRRNYMPSDFRRDARRFNLVGSVYVEAEWDHRDPIGETRWVHDVAKANGLPNAVVAQAWLDRDDAADVLAQQAAFPLVRSVRHKPKSVTDRREARRGAPGSMDDPKWRDGYARLARHGLHFDLQTPWWHLDAATELARDFPATTIILNHTGLPSDRSDDGLSGWRRALETLAAQPNVAIKISGIGVPGRPWTAELNGAVVRDAIRIFGTDRAMFASNFPVDSLVATYDEIFDGFLAMTSDMLHEDRLKLFAGNARRVYRIDA